MNNRVLLKFFMMLGLLSSNASAQSDYYAIIDDQQSSRIRIAILNPRSGSVQDLITLQPTIGTILSTSKNIAVVQSPAVQINPVAGFITLEERQFPQQGLLNTIGRNGVLSITYLPQLDGAQCVEIYDYFGQGFLIVGSNGQILITSYDAQVVLSVAQLSFTNGFPYDFAYSPTDNTLYFLQREIPGLRETLQAYDISTGQIRRIADISGSPNTDEALTVFPRTNIPIVFMHNSQSETLQLTAFDPSVPNTPLLSFQRSYPSGNFANALLFYSLLEVDNSGEIQAILTPYPPEGDLIWKLNPFTGSQTLSTSPFQSSNPTLRHLALSRFY